MVAGSLEACAEIESLHPLFPKAFAFLRRTDLSALAPGRYPIAGADCVAIVSELNLEPVADTLRFEAHRAFVDIQMPLTGSETIGIAVTPSVLADFDEAKDIAFFPARGAALTLRPGQFAIFYPADAHAPGHAFHAPQTIRKIVVKVRL